MKSIITCLVLAFGVSAFADHHGEAAGYKDKGEKFDAHKKEALARIDKHIAAFNEHKSCVSAAADRPAIKACREKMKDNRLEWKEDRDERKADRKGKK